MVKRLVILFILLLVIMPVWAQDTPTPEVPTLESTALAPEVTLAPLPTEVLPPATESPEDILGIVFAALFAGSATIGGSVFVTAIVGLLKMVVPASIASGDTIKNVVSVITWIVYSLAIRFGLGTEFSGIATFLAPILTSLVPLVGVLIGSSKVYIAAKNAHVPIVGYARTP